MTASTDTSPLSLSEIGDALAEAGVPADAAPYGRRSDGQPRSKPGRKPGRAGRSKVRTASSAPPRRPRKPPPGVDYRPGIEGLLQLPAGLLAMAGARNPAFALDAYTISEHGPALAEGLNAVAQENAQVAAVLDRVLQMGPWGAVLVPAMGMAMQLAVNHGLLSAEIAPGTKSPAELAREIGGVKIIPPDMSPSPAAATSEESSGYDPAAG